MKENIKFDFVKRLKEKEDFNLENNVYKLPQKGTKKAAGYDFFNPEDIDIEPNKIVIVKTGVKAYFPEDVGLFLLNRSSNPKKKSLVLMNGVGLVDADYVDNEDNEGEIGFMFMNISSETISIKAGEKLGQGVFMKYLDTVDYSEDEIAERQGGFGSTGN